MEPLVVSSLYSIITFNFQLTALKRPLVVTHDLFENTILDISWFVSSNAQRSERITLFEIHVILKKIMHKSDRIFILQEQIWIGSDGMLQ